MRTLTLDHPRIADWLAKRPEFPETLRPCEVEPARQARHQRLRASDELYAWTLDEAFVVWDASLQEVDTDRSLAGLWAIDGPPEARRSLVRQSLQALQGRSPLVELVAGDDKEIAFWSEFGLELQRHRLARCVEQHSLDTPRQRRFRLRQGREQDRPMLASLAAAHVVHTLPPGRQDRVAEYTASVLQRFGDLQYGDGAALDLLIAEELPLLNSVGYLLIEAGDDGRAFLYDMGVRQSHWGKYVAQFLVRATENLLVQLEVELLVTEISAANRRSFLTACRSLRFEPRRELWGAPLD